MNITKDYLQNMGISYDTFQIGKRVEEEIEESFKIVKEVEELNQFKVLKAMQDCKLSDIHFNWNTGYGYNDTGREMIESIYSKVFGTEDSIVRPTIVSGTHALTIGLMGVLRPGDEILSVTGKPYDTLDDVIGINRKDENVGSLKDFGVSYTQLDLTEDGKINLNLLPKFINNNTRMVYFQRSTGYSWRKALSLEHLKKAISLIKSIKKDTVCMIDNCYGEFLDTMEPTQVGADLMAGSLIKNPGGGLALSGGYIVGKKDLIDLVSYRLTSQGIGKECGTTFGQTRTMLQGLFLAPHVVSEAIRGAIFCSRLFESVGFNVCPKYNDTRSDIIQAIKLNDSEAVKLFCQAIQAAAPVDSFVIPEPWDMPGYDSKVIMAAGAFVQGSSIELSADAPMREPYAVYFQGGLTYNHSKLGALKAFQSLKDNNFI